MKRFILFLILLTASIHGQRWELTTNEPSYITTFAVEENGDVWAGAPGEFYKYSAEDAAWTKRFINGWWANLQSKELFVNSNGYLIALPTGEPGVLVLSGEGDKWEIVAGTENLYSGFVCYGDTILFREKVSWDGGISWESCYYTDRLGNTLLGKENTLFLQTDKGDGIISPYNYFRVSLEDSLLTQISPYAHKRTDELNTAYMNNSIADSVLMTFEEDGKYSTSYGYTTDNYGNIIMYSVGLKKIFRFKNNAWELIYYAAPDESTYGVNYLSGEYAFSDSCIYKINYDSTFSFSKLPGNWPTEIATFGGKVIQQSGNLYINSFGGTREFIQYDLSKKEFYSFRKGLPGQSIQTMRTSKNGIVYAKDDKGYIYKSANNGASWSNLGPYGIEANEQLAVTDSAIFSLGRGICYKSNNGGNTWEKDSSDKISYRHISSDGNTIVRMKDQYMTQGNQIEVSYDNGKTFIFIDSVHSIPTWYMDMWNQESKCYIYTKNGIHLMWSSDKYVLFINNTGNIDTTIANVPISSFTSFSNLYFGRTDAGIVKLDKNELSGNRMFKASAAPEWTFTGLEGKKILSLTSDSLGVVYAGTEDGTYFSADSGATWEVYGTVVSGNLKKTSSTGLSQVKALLVNGSELFAAASEGLYKTKTYGAIGIKEEPNVTVTGFKLAQNYPNPFNPETNISFTLPKAGHVKLTVYNALGQQVEQLVNMELGQGSYNYKFDGRNLSSGVYIYSLEAGTFRMAKKMMLIK